MTEIPTSFLTQAEEDADSYGSWKFAIEWMRQQHLAGRAIGAEYREAEERQRSLRKKPPPDRSGGFDLDAASGEAVSGK